MAARHRGEDIVDFGMGNPDLPTPPHVVAKLVEAASKPQNNRNSVSRGFYRLRVPFSDWYKRRFQEDLIPDAKTIVTFVAKEGISIRAGARTDRRARLGVRRPYFRRLSGAQLSSGARRQRAWGGVLFAFQEL